MDREGYGMNRLNLLIPITAITILGVLLHMGIFNYESSEINQKESCKSIAECVSEQQVRKCIEPMTASTKICNEGNI